MVDNQYAFSFKPSNPEGAKWRRIESFFDQSTDPIKIINEGGVAFSLNGKGYLGLGQNIQGIRPLFFRFDNGIWEELQSDNFPEDLPRKFATAFVLGDYAYVGLGENREANVFYDDFYRFDQNEQWTKVARLPVEIGRSRTPAAVGNGRAFIFGGRSDIPRFNASVYREIYEYIPVAE